MRITIACFAACLALLVAGTAGAEDTSELSYQRFADEQGPEHPLYCMYGYFASKTGDHATAHRILNRCVESAQNPAAMIYLSFFYEEGIGTEPDRAKARALVLRAAQQGYSLAQYLLGSGLLEEAETEDDRREALAWLERAAAQGDEDARALLEGAGAAGG